MEDVRQFQCQRTPYSDEIPEHIVALLHEIKEVMCHVMPAHFPPHQWHALADAITRNLDVVYLANPVGAHIRIFNGEPDVDDGTFIGPGLTVPDLLWGRGLYGAVIFTRPRLDSPFPRETAAALAHDLERALRQRFGRQFGRIKVRTVAGSMFPWIDVVVHRAGPYRGMDLY